MNWSNVVENAIYLIVGGCLGWYGRMVMDYYKRIESEVMQIDAEVKEIHHLLDDEEE